MDKDLEISEQFNEKLPAKYQEKFLIKRFNDEPIEISLRQYIEIENALRCGDRFIKINKHILMLNGIKSIDPKYGEKNIPPRPKPYFQDGGIKYDYPVIDDIPTNKEEIDEWDKYFGDK